MFKIDTRKQNINFYLLPPPLYAVSAKEFIKDTTDKIENLFKVGNLEHLFKKYGKFSFNSVTQIKLATSNII